MKQLAASPGIDVILTARDPKLGQAAVEKLSAYVLFSPSFPPLSFFEVFELLFIHIYIFFGFVNLFCFSENAKNVTFHQLDITDKSSIDNLASYLSSKYGGKPNKQTKKNKQTNKKKERKET